MKRTIQYIAVIVFALILSYSSNVYAFQVQTADADSIIASGRTPSEMYEYRSNDYVIDRYHVNIFVNEDNTLDITETITAYFNVSKHGIYRTIPLRNTVTRLDGTSSKNRTQVTNVSVDQEYTTSRENGNYKIKIGSAERTVTGEQIYKINYTYNLGEDPEKEYDEFYYNIIGDEWDTVIGNVSFTIIMPKEFSADRLGFSAGPAGSTDSNNVEYTVDGNTVAGSYQGILNAGEALTVRCQLPEGYFLDAGLDVHAWYYFMFSIPVLFLGIAVFLWYQFGRDDPVVETVEFYPPAGVNSLEAGFLYKGKADDQDVTSLLIYLANEGYIRISETETNTLFSKSKGFKLTKLKEYEGNDVNEQMFLDGLFHIRSSSKRTEVPLDDRDEVTSKDLYNKFYITMRAILSNVNNRDHKDRIFERSASGKTIWIITMILIAYCIITVPPVLTYSDLGTAIIALLFPGIGFTVMFTIIFGKSPLFQKVFTLIWGGLFGGVPWIYTVMPVLVGDPVFLAGYSVGIGCILGMFVCLKYLPKRTPYGNEMLGKLRGFKSFLEVAEKDRLEAMVMEDPGYFYHILPYTYVLGVSDKWIKKFEAISLQAPSWYDGMSSFDTTTFGSFMNSTMASANSAMSSSPSDSSGSGGGSSGGGSGGGGGGSW